MPLLTQGRRRTLRTLPLLSLLVGSALCALPGATPQVATSAPAASARPTHHVASPSAQPVVATDADVVPLPTDAQAAAAVNPALYAPRAGDDATMRRARTELRRLVRALPAEELRERRARRSYQHSTGTIQEVSVELASQALTVLVNPDRASVEQMQDTAARARRASSAAVRTVTASQHRQRVLVTRIRRLAKLLGKGTPTAELRTMMARIAHQNLTKVATEQQVSFPLPVDSGFTDLHNWGSVSAHWASWHTGDDFSVACGTPVYAATAGTVSLLNDQPWAGPYLVQISTGPGQLATWYAHMQEVIVQDGQQVQAGQVIGRVGAMGNATGCHLHFELHPVGGTIYQDSTDPDPWLKATGAYPGYSRDPYAIAHLTISPHPQVMYQAPLPGDSSARRARAQQAQQAAKLARQKARRRARLLRQARLRAQAARTAAAKAAQGGSAGPGSGGPTGGSTGGSGGGSTGASGGSTSGSGGSSGGGGSTPSSPSTPSAPTSPSPTPSPTSTSTSGSSSASLVPSTTGSTGSTSSAGTTP